MLTISCDGDGDDDDGDGDDDEIHNVDTREAFVC